MSQAEDVGSAVGMEKMEQQQNFSDISALLGKSHRQILAAQFECYLKIIHDPPRTEKGDKAASIV